MSEELKYNEPWILQRADPYVYRHTDGNYYFTASVPAYDRIVLRRSKTLAGLKDAEEITVWKKHPKNTKMSSYACAKCHTPSSSNYDDLMTKHNDIRPEANNSTQREGISCAYCHRIESIEPGKMSNTNIIAKEGKSYFGSLKSHIESPFHKIKTDSKHFNSGNVCVGCHSQMIRPFRAETERYGHYSVAGEFIYDRPFLWGSKRTGPDLHRVGGRYSDDWHRLHLINPRDLVPESIMPAYPWLETTALDGSSIQDKMRVLAIMGHPYTDAEIEAAPAALEGKKELDAVIAYLQSLGLHVKLRR